MSVNPDMSATMGVADEYVDLEHQLIRQRIEVPSASEIEVSVGDPAGEFDPGERQLDREEIAQLVYYRRYAYAAFELDNEPGNGETVVCDASFGINGDLFREVSTTTEEQTNVFVSRGGEIGLLDNYAIQASPVTFGTAELSSGQAMISEFAKNYYDWPTGGPIVDSFDTLNAGFVATNNNTEVSAIVELRYDLYWDVAEQGRSTNPFGRPSTR